MRPAGDLKLMWCYAPNILFLIMYLGKLVKHKEIYAQRLSSLHIWRRVVCLIIYLHRVKTKQNTFPITQLSHLSLKENKQREFNTQSDNRLVCKAILQLEMLRFRCALFLLLPAPLVYKSILASCCNLILWLWWLKPGKDILTV